MDVVLFKAYDPSASSVADALIDTIGYLLLSFHSVALRLCDRNFLFM